MAPSLLAAIHRFGALETAAADDGAACIPLLLAAIADPADRLTAIAAVHAAGAAGAEAAASLLVPLLRSGPPHLAEHAA